MRLKQGRRFSGRARSGHGEKGELRQREDAVAALLGFGVAILIAMAAVSVVLVQGGTEVDGQPMRHASLESDAEAIGSVLRDTSGVGWETGMPTRLGLAAGPGTLDPDHLQQLRGARLAADAANGVVDYEEARQALGLDDGHGGGQDFRLRVQPVDLGSAVQRLRLDDLRTGYVADWKATPSAHLPPADDAQLVRDANTAADATMSARAAQERAMLVDLGVGMQDVVHLDSATLSFTVAEVPERPLRDVVAPGALDGDVYPDTKAYLRDVLIPRLGMYDVLIIGSGVDHNALTSDDIKTAIREWVLAGGTLHVMGSGSQTAQWMQPLFDVGTATVNGGGYAPDADHPLLNEPHDLAWESYGVPVRAWNVGSGGGSASDFDSVLTTGSGDLLTLSRPGVFGQGNVLLTAYQPGTLVDSIGQAQAQALLHNMLVHADRGHLYVDYGPTVPDGVVTGTSGRITTIHDSQLGPVLVRLEVVVWERNV